MSKVTSKYQVTIPKAIAKQYNIHPGDQIDWSSAGDSIRVTPLRTADHGLDLQLKLRLFDELTQRIRRRSAKPGTAPRDRGWMREDLYTRGRSR
jgi:AbrB family looped-hinge helix DNA binding protein